MSRNSQRQRRQPIRDEVIVHNLESDSDDDGDFSSGSGDQYCPENDNESSSSSSVSNDENDPVVEGPSCDRNPEYQWTYGSSRPRQFSFVGESGIKIDANFTPASLADLFFSEDFIKTLVDATNEYANRTAQPLQRHSRFRYWKNTTPHEMRRFIGMLLYMGVVRLPVISYYWRLDRLYNLPLFRSLMSRNRFQLLLRYFHFSKDDEQNKQNRLHKINPVLERFNLFMSDIYYPERDLSIDESMVLWRGRLVFRQYIKNKKHKYGIKLYELCESSGLVMKIRVYRGKNEKPPPGTLHSTEVVLDLLDGYLDKGHNLYTDNFYNSVDLTRNLGQRKTYICGTLRSNRKGNPSEVILAKLKKGELAFQSCDDITVCKWKDKRDVLVITNKHNVEMVNVRNQNGKISSKPNIVVDYNLGMSGIDRGDQMVSYYSCLRKTLRWHKKLALHIFDVYVQNAHRLLRKKDRTTKVRLIKFREDFILHLLGMSDTDTPASTSRASTSTQSNQLINPIARDPSDTFHYLEKIPPTEKKKIPGKPCRVCTKEKKRKESCYFCPVCPEKPALCILNCFKIYHKDPRFV